MHRIPLVTVYNLKYAGKGKESNCCPACGATREGLIKRFLTANQPATFAVGKSLYDAIPPRPVRKESSSTTSDDLFSDDLFGSLDTTVTEIDCFYLTDNTDIDKVVSLIKEA